MFKKFILAALVAAPMMLSAQNAVKFGMVNPAEIFQVMPETATAQNTLKKRAKNSKNLKKLKPIKPLLKQKLKRRKTFTLATKTSRKPLNKTSKSNKNR